MRLGPLIAEVTDVRWSHPAWLALAGGTALLETLARLAPDPLEADPYSAYLSANGTPRSDTFMARDLSGSGTTAARIARAVARACAAGDGLAELDGHLPGQPLSVALRFERGWLRRVPLPPAREATFITPAGRFSAPLASPEAVARALGRVCAGRDARPPLRDATPTSVAVDVSPQPPDRLRHLHRRAWSAAGGPWLGVGETDALEVVTTCHLAIDGYGHGLVASRIFSGVDRRRADLAGLEAAATAGLDGAPVTLLPAPPVAGEIPLGFAARVVDARLIAFPRAAYALGRTLEKLRPGPGAFTPTFTVTIAPGERDDAERRRRRIAFALLALRKTAGAVEPFPSFRARLRSLVARESVEPGLHARVLAATANAPLPRGLRRRLLSSQAKPSRWVPPVEVLGGRGSLALIRYPDGEAPPEPLYAASSPGVVATSHDPLGSFVVTIVDHGARCTVSLDGMGVAGTADGARGVLETFVSELRTLES